MKKFVLSLIIILLNIAQIQATTITCWLNSKAGQTCSTPEKIYKNNCSEKRVKALTELGISESDYELVNVNFIPEHLYEYSDEFDLRGPYSTVEAVITHNGSTYSISSAFYLNGLLQMKNMIENYRNDQLSDEKNPIVIQRNEETAELARLHELANDEFMKRARSIADERGIIKSRERYKFLSSPEMLDLQKEIYNSTVGFEDYDSAENEITNKWYYGVQEQVSLYTSSLLENYCQTNIELIGSTSKLPTNINQYSRNSILTEKKQIDEERSQSPTSLTQ